ncbi:MAG: hypothetical protein JW834_00375 [Candidatus Diapherotrites archaeon]|nr:hypothetical protein [Candidatus Diapherotrites archaeon]
MPGEEDVSTLLIAQKLASSLKSIKEELQAWHEESGTMQARVKELQQKVDSISSKAGVPAEVTKQMLELRNQVTSLNQKIVRMDEITAKLQAMDERLAKLSLIVPEDLRQEIVGVHEQVQAITQKTATVNEILSKLEGMSVKEFVTEREFKTALTEIRRIMRDSGLEELKDEIYQLEAVSGMSDDQIREELDAVKQRFTELSRNIGGFDQLNQRIMALENKVETTVVSPHVEDEINKLKEEITSISLKTNRLEDSLKRVDLLASKEDITEKQLVSEMTHMKSELQDVEGMGTVKSKVEELSQATGRTKEEVRTEIDELRRQVHGVTSEIEYLKALGKELKGIEEQVSASVNQISELRQRLQEVKKLPVEEQGREIEALKERVSEVAKEAGKYGEIQTMLEKYDKEFFSGMKQELDAWHSEAKQNQSEVRIITKRLDELSKKTDVSLGFRKDINSLKDTLSSITDDISRMQNLKQRLGAYHTEFDSIYSSLGKEKVNMDQLGSSINGLQEELKEWSERNKENRKSIQEMRKEMTDLSTQLRQVDSRRQVEDLTQRIEALTDRIEQLRQQEAELAERQVNLSDFDEQLKELVRKAVTAMLTREEFETQLQRMPSHKAPLKPLPRIERPAQKPQAKAFEEKPEPSVEDKLKALRTQMEKAKPKSLQIEAPEPAEDVLLDKLEELETNLENAEDPELDLVWDNARNDFVSIIEADLSTTKEEAAKKRESGAEVSKLNLLLTKQDLGVVSLETAFSSKDIERIRESTRRLVDLRKQTLVEIGK